MASLGQSFPDCGLQSPQGHERVQRGLWSVRKNSAGQQLLTFSWLEEWGCGFTRLSLQHQFWLLVFPFQPFPTACFIFPPAGHGPLGSSAALVCGSAVKRIRNLIQFGGRRIKTERFLCQSISELDLFPAPVHCKDASMAVLVEQREWCGASLEQGTKAGAGTQPWRAVLAKPQPPGRFNYGWQEVMLSREWGIALQSLNCWQQLGSSREGEQAFIPKAKIAAESCSPACGARMAAGSGAAWRKVLQKGFESTGLGIPTESFSLGAHDRSSPGWWRTHWSRSWLISGGLCAMESLSCVTHHWL